MGAGARAREQGSAPKRRVRVAILAAHPDDETLGASALLGGVPGCVLVHLTDGVPRDARFRPAGSTGAEYALQRRGELAEALAVVGVPPERTFTLGGRDQEAVLDLVPLTRALVRTLDALRPERLVTHAYDGGHPDHDAAALVARAARDILLRAGRAAPRLFEMALYHGAGGRLRTLEFLPSGDSRVLTRRLAPAERARKAQMLSRFASQRDVLGWFEEPRVERLRAAPRVDFLRPPHEGQLWYERMGFPLPAERWRAAAADALRALERERLR